jgi:hypothetical protein
VSLFDQASEIGGQFNFAKQIPGKEEFHETLRYFAKRLRSAASSSIWASARVPRACWAAVLTR